MLITHELMNNKSYLVKRYVEICIFKQKKLKKFLNKKFSVPFTHGIALIFTISAYFAWQLISGINSKNSAKINQYLVVSFFITIVVLITGVAFLKPLHIIEICWNIFVFIHAYSLFLKIVKDAITGGI
ncbi:hypothetical protein ACKWTF_001542 [Chironomus riparius]